ncbi:hypothetical protein PMAYCL1PPCAC_20785, partial [Pristionchus mayeri]
DFSASSPDALVSIFSSTFKASSLILNNSDPGQIQRALKFLDLERTTCLQLEKTEKLSIRSLSFGIIESYHLTLLHFTGADEGAYKNAIASLEKWKT